MAATMLQRSLSLLTHFTYTAGLVFTTFNLTIGTTSTVQWLYFDSGNVMDFLHTFQCKPISAATAACTLGHGSSQLSAIASDTLLDQLPGLMLTPWKIKLLSRTAYLVPDPYIERYTMVSKWASGWTQDDNDDGSSTLDIIAPANWIPARSRVLIWIGSFILVAAVVTTVYCVVRTGWGNGSLGEGRLVATHGRIKAWRGDGLGAVADHHHDDDGDDCER